MAIACAGLLGYKFPANFDSPYLSANIQDFWRRWHISLSSWLRDYLYIPLGGNRRGNGRRDVNLMTTMVNLAWIFFRAADLGEALSISQTYLTWSSAGQNVLPIAVWPLLACLGLAHWLSHRFGAQEMIERLAPNRFAVTYGAIVAIAIAFVPLGYRPFIYFQF